MSRRSRSARPALRALSRRWNLEALEARELLTGYTVMTAADNGDNVNPTPNSLRAAIVASNTNNMLGGDTISFNIPGGGVPTIAVSAALPTIAKAVILDATTQPGTTPVGVPRVVIDGSMTLGASGLTLAGGGSTVRGLSVVGFQGGAGIFLQSSSDHDLLVDDYLGIEPDGSTAKGNANGLVVASPGNTIGGESASTANVISGNVNSGVLIGGAASGNVVEGNLIGTDASGDVAVGNLYGVAVMSPNNTIGGAAAGSANVISGNSGSAGQSGVGVLFLGQATADVVEGNKIGTNASGSAAVPNVYGVYFGTPGGATFDNVMLDTVGGTTQDAGNLISGNFFGISGGVTSALIAGNAIGLNAAATAAIPNGDGIYLSANLTTIGGTTTAARNVISGSGETGAAGTGIFLNGDSDLIQGNAIGAYNTSAGNAVGLDLNVTNSTIGGTASGAGNVISGNTSDAIRLSGNGGDLIEGNSIGVSTLGSSIPSFNGGNGIVVIVPIIVNGTVPHTSVPPVPINDTIGGTAAGAGNTIANNAGAGVRVPQSPPDGYTGLAIRGNTIFGNGGLGIDLNGTGVPTPSTLFITSSSTANGLLTVAGVFFGTPSTSYGIDLFANSSDPTGYGQGPVFLGGMTVTTNASGFATFSPTFAAPSTPYTAFSATSTGPNGDTSEFSANAPLASTAPTADLALTATASSSSAIAGGLLTITETVINNGPGTATGVMLADSLPISLTNAKVSAGAGTASLDANNVLTAGLGSLASGQSDTVTITGIASVAGRLIAKPGVSSTTLDPNYFNNQGNLQITVAPAPPPPTADLAIAETASPSPVLAGGKLTYTLTVTNIGPSTATNATINDLLPLGVTLVSAAPSQGATPTVNGTLLADNLGTIASGASATLTIVVIPAAAGSIANAANVSGNQTDPITANNSTSLTTTVLATAPTVPRVTLILAQAVLPAVGTFGQFQTIILTAANFGADPADNVIVIDVLPPNVRFAGASPTQGSSPLLVNGQVAEDFGTIPAHGSATITIKVTPIAGGQFVNITGTYLFDDPAVTPSYAYDFISIPTGPSVVGVSGQDSNKRLMIAFDEALIPSSATNKANYRITSLGKAARGPTKSVAIASVSFNSAIRVVTITPTKGLDPTQYYQVVVIGSTSSGLADTLGRRLVNPQYTTPGADYSAVFFAGTLPQG